ncbi:MAG: ABC transporter permease [Dehalococcoidales bacterium]|nr:ABC transporter permease [Dehalococcoidales bacterium]
MMYTLIKKEVKELLSKSSLAFFAAMALIFVFMGNMLSSSFEESTATPMVAIINEDASPLSMIMTSVLEAGSEVVYSGPDQETGRTQLEEAGGSALINIPENFGSLIDSGEAAQIKVLWLMQGAGIVDSIPVGSVEGLIQAGADAVSATLVAEHSTLDPEIILSPVSYSYDTVFKGKMIEGASPSMVSGVLSMRTMFIPVVIMMLIVMGSSSVISSMGLEKENRTLETLLTLPVGRSQIIISKIVGSAIAGIVMGAIYMVGFASYFNSITGPAGGLGDMGFTLNVLDYLLIALSLFAALLAALCASIILGTFASSYRSAQTLTYPMIGLAMLAMLVTMMLDFSSLSFPLQTMVFLIPFSHPMIAMKELMVGNYLLVLAGIGYLVVITAILVVIATRIFTTDRVVLGMSIKSRKNNRVTA